MNKLLLYLIRFIGMKYFEREFKKSAVLAYLKALQMLRKSLLGSFFLLLLFQFISIGFVGTVVGILYLIPSLDTEVRLYLLVGFFFLMFLIPFLIFMTLLSERLWYKASGAEKMLE